MEAIFEKAKEFSIFDFGFSIGERKFSEEGTEGGIFDFGSERNRLLFLT
jgi:hypothetical protein